jgi:hypothetical protein
MRVRLLLIVALLVVGAAALTVGRVAGAQFVQPDHLRFRLIGDEQISSPDGRSVVTGWKVVVLRDTRSDQCYTMFVSGSAMTSTGPSVCP